MFSKNCFLLFPNTKKQFSSLMRIPLGFSCSVIESSSIDQHYSKFTGKFQAAFSLIGNICRKGGENILGLLAKNSICLETLCFM